MKQKLTVLSAGFVAVFVAALIMTVCGSPSHAVTVGGEIAHDCWVLDPNYVQIAHTADENHGTRCAGVHTLATDYRCNHSWESRTISWGVSMNCFAGVPCEGAGSWTCYKPDGTKYKTPVKTLSCPGLQSMKATSSGITCFTGEEGQSNYTVVAHVPACP